MNILSEEGYLHLAFKADPADLKKTLEELQTKKISVRGPVKRGDGESIYFNDPDDNHLEIHCDNP